MSDYIPAVRRYATPAISPLAYSSATANVSALLDRLVGFVNTASRPITSVGQRGLSYSPIRPRGRPAMSVVRGGQLGNNTGSEAAHDAGHLGRFRPGVGSVGRCFLAGKSRFASVLVVLAVVGAACGSGDSSTTSSPEGTGDALADEPFPTVEQLQGAGDCDELNRMMAGVENENFRVNNDRTAAEEEERVEDVYDTAFDIYYQTFSERQGDLECSDAEMMGVLQTAGDQRCQAWIDEGHSLDENPLLLNTAFCIDANN